MNSRSHLDPFTGCHRCGMSCRQPSYVDNDSMIAAYPRGLADFEGQIPRVYMCQSCYRAHCVSAAILGRGRLCFHKDHPGFATSSCEDPVHVIAAVLGS